MQKAFPSSSSNRAARRAKWFVMVVTAALFCSLGSAVKGNSSLPSEEASRMVTTYLEGLARSDGGYGWSDQPDSHLTPTFAVIGSYRLLGQPPPRREALARFVRTGHPLRGEHSEARYVVSRRRTFVIEQVQSLLWLGEEASQFESHVQGWARPARYAYERDDNPVFQQEMMAFLGRELLGLPLTDLSPTLTDYLHSRRRTDGSFNNTPAADGSEGHVLNTWWGLQALHALGAAGEKRAETVAWLQACQMDSGGFTYRPGADIGGIEDIAYTWAAVRALASLGAGPRDRDGCLGFLRSLWNADGGFGDRPGLGSRPMATYYALDTLAALGALSELGGASWEPRPAPVPPELPAGLRPFTVQVQAPGQGSPAEAVELARALRIHLWGAKNAEPGWIERAQQIADQRGVPVRFFVSNEEYGSYVGLPGLGVYNHTSDLNAPAGVDFGPSMAGRVPEPMWNEFRDERIGAVRRAGGWMVWQLCENDEFTRILLDDSIEQGGYDAVSTFHFWCRNFAYTFPVLFRYGELLPFVALQDAHGLEPWWWGDDLTGYRTIFLAREPTWNGLMEALGNNWVVSIRHDRYSGFRTRMLGGAPGVQEFVRRHQDDWKWWGERADDLQRPELSLLAITPEDKFEAGRPEQGVVVRLRCWRRSTPQGTPVDPVVELAGISIDGDPVSPQRVERRNDAGVVTDIYYKVVLDSPSPGQHTASATAIRLDTGARLTREIQFRVPRNATD